MERMISYCGLDCAACPVYRATQKDDDAKRAKVAGAWSRLFGYEFKIADINCDGCAKTDGRLFGHCTRCAVRQCGMEKRLENCAHCGDYACEKLTGLLATIPNPAAKENLEEIRRTLGM
ncbi:MAG: DUF3795 domain-containing protein [Spirochaetes bacterium]|nr:DUF3795 domain-containing protein [Spirochaetota bacterium]